jgi:glucose/arabinose dehydrogenase
MSDRMIRAPYACALLASALVACESSESTAVPAEESVVTSDDASVAKTDDAQMPSEAGTTTSPQSGNDASPSGGDGGLAPDGSSAGTDGIERDVLRPESRAPSDALIASLQLPPGFAISVFARELEHARMLAVRGASVYLTRPRQGDVLRLVDGDGDGLAEQRSTVAAGLPDVHGITIDGPYVYLATPTSVYRATVAEDGSFGTPAAIIDDLPAGGQHPNRTIAVGPDRKLYISIGSPCDACPIDDPEYATLLRAELDGSRREIFAEGLRNTIGFGFQPETGELWGFDHGSDWRGDDIPPEELNRIVAGQHYGWPYCYGERRIDPVIQMPPMSTKEAYCAMTTGPVLENQAHQAPIGMVFYTATQFPSAYRNGAFVAFRGSWNRIPATGYRVAFVAYEAGKPVRIDDFVTGFLIEGGTAQFGRLAGIAVASDGSLLFTDDENGVIYRVQHDAQPMP